GGWVAPGFLCHLLDASEHLCHDGHGEKNRIPSVGQLCQAFERRWNKCSQVDWRMRLLHGLKIDIRLGHVEKLAVKFHRICGPNCFEQWQKFIGQSASCFHVGAGCVHFVFVPAKTQTDAQPAVGKDIRSEE